jgi:predicted O-methyltransferase YrrM
MSSKQDRRSIDSIKHMTDKIWTKVDRYLAETLIEADAGLDAVLAANAAAGLPSIDVTPTQAQFLQILARMVNARRILEIGTLGGYSTIWLARGLAPGGRLITLEFDPKHARVAVENIARAGLSDRVEIRIGAAADSLAVLASEQAGQADPFDLIFIDADKPNNAVYLDWALKLSRVGTLIVCDNVIRDGKVADEKNTDPSVVGTRAMFARMASEPRLVATALQTVGSKGYDGFAVALVVEQG